MKRLHIFAAGTHTDQNGNKVTLTEADVAASAAAYDPAKHEAPLVVGHPRTDDPAYGWVSSAFAEGKDLFADPIQVDPAFAEIVDKGRYKKISSSFYAPESPANPVPGIWYLKHVGFLGAQPPAVKGLRSVAAFADGAEGVVEFADWAATSNSSLWRRLRDWFISAQGMDVADQVLPDYEINYLRDQAQQADAAPSPAFAEPPQESTVTKAWPSVTHPRNFISVRRTADVLHESLEYAMLQFIDQPITPALIDAIVASVNAFIRTLIGRGALIDGKCIYDPAKNPTTEVALGHLTFSLEFMPPTPGERFTFESFINIELLKQLAATE